jgi:hypothetical protein
MCIEITKADYDVKINHTDKAAILDSYVLVSAYPKIEVVQISFQFENEQFFR